MVGTFSNSLMFLVSKYILCNSVITRVKNYDVVMAPISVIYYIIYSLLSVFPQAISSPIDWDTLLSVVGVFPY